MAEQELMFKAALLERQAEELNSNVSYIANQIAELEQFKETLKSIGDSKTKEVLSSLGKGVYVKTSMEDKNLLVSIGANVVISTGKHYLGNDFGSILETPVLELPITIGSGVWIGANVTILPGVIIAPGCIIGANSVLLKSTGPNEIWGGVPAKLIKNVEPISRDASY